MAATEPHAWPAALILQAETAADLMTANPVSIRSDASIYEAAAFLIAKEISAAPVVDAAGRAVGVISHTDIVRYASEVGTKQAAETEYYREFDRRCPPGLREIVSVSRAKPASVADVMSPTVIKVGHRDSSLSVVAELLALKIHRLFVVDDAGTLVGVIAALDVLRCLRRT
jgi:CBS domain-containing protein